MHGGVWSTSRVNDIHLAKFILIYRGLTEFSEMCTLNGADLYLDSLILNTQHGHMPCHQDIAKLEGIDNIPDSPVDLTSDADIPPKQEINTDVKPAVKRENRKDTQVISSMSVLHTQPKNKLKTSLYRKSLQLLLKAKVEIKTKEHIQNVSIDPAMVAKRARNRRTNMISSNCELCGELCRSQRAYVWHRTEFHPTQPYHCRYHNKQYLSATGCYKHERYHVSPGCSCMICGHKFKAESELRDHLPTHNEEHKVQCGQCGKLFSTKRTLKWHSEVHMGLTFQCPHCDHQYATRECLRVHVLGFHGTGYTTLCGKENCKWPGKRQRHQQKCTVFLDIAAKKGCKNSFKTVKKPTCGHTCIASNKRYETSDYKL